MFKNRKLIKVIYVSTISIIKNIRKTFNLVLSYKGFYIVELYSKTNVFYSVMNLARFPNLNKMIIFETEIVGI